MPFDHVTVPWGSFHSQLPVELKRSVSSNSQRARATSRAASSRSVTSTTVPTARLSVPSSSNRNTLSIPTWRTVPSGSSTRYETCSLAPVVTVRSAAARTCMTSSGWTRA